MGQYDAHGGPGGRPRILFVDDEPLVIRSLRRTLASRSDRWDLDFAESAEQALQIAADSSPDVVVSDMRMPGMDGATFLERVQDLYPDVVRIILSGHTEPRLVFRAVPVAHQFLTKPFDSALLVSTLERAVGLRRLIGDPRLRSIVGANHELPTAPATYVALSRALSHDATTITEVTGLVERDPSVAARISHLASSSFFRVPRTVSGLAGYASYLGLDTIKSLVLTVEVVDVFGKNGTGESFSIDDFQRHSVDVGHIARRIVTRREQAEDAFLAGLLHDVGRLVLAARMPAEFAKVTALCEQSGLETWRAELEVLGTTHAEVGAYLLGLWGLPIDIVDAVARHHRPSMLHSSTVTEAGAVYVANTLARVAERTDAPADSVLDQDYVRQLGDNARVDTWRRAAQEIAGASG